MYSTAAFLATAAAMAGVATAQQVQVQAVQVASSNGTLAFYPDRITAPEGSMVQFQFMGGNHTVTQSSFDNPCQPMDDGIFSGYVPVDASANMGQRPTWSIMVNSTDPMWLFCGQGQHCANGMAMVINENVESGNTLDNYKAAAAQLGDSEDGDSASGAGGAGGDGNGQAGDANGNGADGENGANGGANGQGEAAEDGEDDAEIAGASTLAVSSSLLVAVGTAFLLI